MDRGRTKGVDEETERTFKKVKMLNWRKGTHRFSLSQKRAKTEAVEKNVVFFQMTGKYVKGENKGQKKDSQIKENREKRDTFKKDKKEIPRKNKCSREQKMKLSKKQTRKNKKKKTFFVKGIEKRQTYQKKTYKFVKMSKKRKKIFETCRSFRKSL